MLKAYSVASIRAAEEQLAAQIGWDALIQRAVAALGRALNPIPGGAVVVMLIGPGNNGADALYAAVDLLDRGVRVDLCLLRDDGVHGPALAAALDAGATIIDQPGGHRYCIDAVVGIGARPGLSSKAADWAQWVRARRPWTIAVDVPSGVDVDHATTPGPLIAADLTVTFGGYKAANLLAPAAAANGQVMLADLGLDEFLEAPAVTALEPDDGRLLADHLPDPSGHKYTRGVVGVIAGSAQYPGAAHLTVAGAHGGPAGMVRFVGSADLTGQVIDKAPEVVAGDGRVQAWVVGPGAGLPPSELNVFERGVPVVLDAAALDPSRTSGKFQGPVVMTPHAGELARLLGQDRSVIEASPLDAARAAADQFEATVLLKGQRTVIADPSGRTAVNLSGTPWLATAGSGDVLAGLIGSLLTCSMSTFDAARWGAFLHGAAAVAANGGGPVTASEVAAHLRPVLGRLLRGELSDVHRGDWT